MFSKMKIKTHITVLSLIMVLLPLLICVGVVTVQSYFNALSSAADNMEQMAVIASERIRWELEAFTNITLGAGCNPLLSDPSATIDAKKEFVDGIAAQHGFSLANIIGADGKSIFDGVDFSDKESYIQAMKGNTSISDPTVSPVTGELTIVSAAPIWKDGKFGTEPLGCVYFVPDPEFLNDIMREIHVSPNSAAYMIAQNGNTIADVDADIVKNGENLEAASLENDGYKELAKIHEKMRAGETGFYDYHENGKRMFMSYAPVGCSNGWSVAIYTPAKDFISNTYSTIVVAIILIIVAIAISIITATLLGKDLGDPIKKCTERLILLSKGDLSSPVTELNREDEIGTLSKATNSLVNSFNTIIGDMDDCLTRISNGDFDISEDCNAEVYMGDFHKLKGSVNVITTRLSETMRQIDVASEQVSCGADQVSNAAQALSQGATEQASSIEELSATIMTISEMINHNAKSAETASNTTNEAGEKMMEANRKMEGLVSAMNEISESSAQIKNIIKTIEDIAFQTNILALNAAIEAARAGDAGKGFAVVADEVRNLAAKSAEAAQNTTNMIEGTVHAINNGSALVSDVANVMEQVSTAAGHVAELNVTISEASKEAADSITQITVGVEQISNVVQNNSATAEESAAASEELSGQAQMLDSLVSQFKLKA